MVILSRHRARGQLLRQHVLNLLHHFLVAGHLLVSLRVIQVLKRIRCRFGQALDVNTPAGQLGSQARILSFAPNRQG